MGTQQLSRSWQSAKRKMTETFHGYHDRISFLCSWWEKMSYPDAVFLLVLFPVASCVTEHQAVARHPVRAAVSSLRGHCCNLHSVSQVHLEPLLSIGICWGPTASSWNSIRERESCSNISQSRDFHLSERKTKEKKQKYSVQLKPLYNPKTCPTSLHKPLVL